MPHAPSRVPGEDPRVWAAWRAQVAAVAQHVPLHRQLLAHERELLPRFAAHYTRLRACPRRVRRAMQRQWRQSVAGIALLLTLAGAPALAATINVGGACTLIQAIRAANTDTATGGCPAGSVADRIVLPVGSTQTLTRVHNDTYGRTGLPVIRSVITIVGQESTITRDSGAPYFRIFAVSSTGELTLQGTTVSGGAYADSGGGILNHGTLTVTNSTISGNYVSYDGGGGGGIYNVGTLNVANSTISGNWTNIAGGDGPGGGYR